MPRLHQFETMGSWIWSFSSHSSLPLPLPILLSPLLFIPPSLPPSKLQWMKDINPWIYPSDCQAITLYSYASDIKTSVCKICELESDLLQTVCGVLQMCSNAMPTDTPPRATNFTVIHYDKLCSEAECGHQAAEPCTLHRSTCSIQSPFSHRCCALQRWWWCNSWLHTNS